MSKPLEVLGEIVDRIRAMRRQGAKASEILRYLEGLDLLGGESDTYLKEAFFLRRMTSVQMLPPEPEAWDRAYDPRIEATRPQWMEADPYPDLMRRRDRRTFSQVARERACVIVVQAANPHSGQFIGKEGYRPGPPYLLALSRRTAPDAGLLAADPADTALMEILRSMDLTYEAYRRQLDRLGFVVRIPENGFVVRDQEGGFFYPGYCIQGMYLLRNGRNAWTGREGEKIRADLNRRMGADLIQHGPLEVWDQRAKLWAGSPLRVPRPPVLLFHPEGNVKTIHDAATLAMHYKALKIPWKDLYPPDPAPVEEGAAL